MRCTNLNPKLKPFGPGLKRSDFFFFLRMARIGCTNRFT